MFNKNTLSQHSPSYQDIDNNIINLLEAIDLKNLFGDDNETERKTLENGLEDNFYDITKAAPWIWSCNILANILYKNSKIAQSHILYNYILNKTSHQLEDNFYLHFENNKTYYSMYDNILKRKILDSCEHPEIISSIQNEENKHNEEESKYDDYAEKNTDKQHWSLQNKIRLYLTQLSNLLHLYHQTPEPDVNMIAKIKWTIQLCKARSLLPANFKRSEKLFKLCLEQKNINIITSTFDQCYALYLLTICYFKTKEFKEALNTAKKIDEKEGIDNESSEYIFKLLPDRAYIKGLCYFHEENYSAAYNEFKTSTTYSASNNTISLTLEKIDLMFFLMTLIQIKEHINISGLFKNPYDNDQAIINLENIIKEIKNSKNNLHKIKNSIDFLFTKKQLIGFAKADQKIEYLFADIIKCMPKKYSHQDYTNENTSKIT